MSELHDEEIRLNGEKINKRKIPYKTVKFVIVIFAIIVLAIVVFFVLSKFDIGNFSGKVNNFVEDDIIGTEGKVTTITESSLEEVLEISELQTADYIYNAIAEVYDENNENLKYYVAYEGTVTAGIDFSKVKIEISEGTKEIVLTVPEVSIQDAVVDAGSLEYIFNKEKYDNENVYKEAYAACQSDLDKKASSESELLDMAKDNAKQVIEALVTPWVQQIDSEYTVTIQ